MNFLYARDAVDFPAGDNSTDTILGNTHFNLTTLEFFNYTLYSNGTVSNRTKCYLAYAPAEPEFLLTNGSFVNATSCYHPIKPMGTRASVAVGVGAAYAVCLVFIMFSLNKLGRLHLPAEKRWIPIGRRWQWYWAIWVSVFGFISLFMNVDVDRFYILGLPIVLTSFIWYLMQLGALALVWEAVRHWGSWLERQLVDPDPFSLKDDDRRSKVEFWLPLGFYLCFWLNFFMVIPRNWGQIEQQRSPDQTAVRAKPSATDARFKAGAFLLLVGWFIILFSIRHSVKHYKPRNRGIVNKAVGLWRYLPLRLMLFVPLSLALVAYQILCSFSWDNSVLNAHQSSLVAVFLGGYGPALLILVVQIIWGFRSTNEDLKLKDQRRRRGEQYDREMGHVVKPAWWQRVKNAANMGSSEEQGTGGTSNPRNRVNSRAVEMDRVGGPNSPGARGARRTSQAGLIDPYKQNGFSPNIKSDRRRSERAVSGVADMLFPSAASQEAAGRSAARREELFQDGPAPPPYTNTSSKKSEPQVGATIVPTDQNESSRPDASRRNGSTATGSSTSGQPQRIKSMLDV